MRFFYRILQKFALMKRFIRKSSYWLEFLSWLFFSPSKFKSIPKKINKVLIVTHGALGDTFSSLRIANNIKAANREIECFMLVDNKSYPLIRPIERYLGVKILSDNDLKNKNFDLTLLFNHKKLIKRYKRRLGFIIGNEYYSITGLIGRSFDFF